LMEQIRPTTLDPLNGKANNFEELEKKLEGLGLERLSGWGKPPRNTMLSDDGDFIIPGLLLGNVFLG